MSGETDLIKLYSGQILELAADIPHLGRLDNPSASVKKRSPLCGSTVTVDIEISDGKVSAFAQDVKACALGQAAASVVGSGAIGRDLAGLTQARNELRALLKSDAATPASPFEKFEILRPAAAYKNRHASILLSIEATVEAAELALESLQA